MMDAFAFHPYPESSSTSPSLAHPNSTAIGLADYPKLVSLLGTAFDGTAQHGSTLPIIYDEFGIETTVPATKTALYVGKEPATTKPVDEAVQAQAYLQAMQMTFCQPTVMGLLLFHVQDEPALAAWQSGEFYVDGSPKASLFPVRSAAASVHRGIVAACPNLVLTPKLKLKVGKPTAASVKVTLSCSLDCAYSITLDGGRRTTGTAVGGSGKTLVFRGLLQPGRHRFAGSAKAALNTGPPGVASVTFKA